MTPRTVRLLTIDPEERVVGDHTVQLHERFAVWEAPPAAFTHTSWQSWAAQQARWLHEATGMTVVVIPPGSRLRVVEVTEEL